MARQLRIEYPEAWYHVMNRGRRRERAFLDDADVKDFVDLLKTTSGMFHIFHGAWSCAVQGLRHGIVPASSKEIMLSVIIS